MILNHSQRFIAGLQQGNREIVRAVPKSELHSHAGLGYRIARLEKFAGRKIPLPAAPLDGIEGMNHWIKESLADLYSQEKYFEFAIMSALSEALSDGIVLLEMSIDVSFMAQFNNDADSFVQIIDKLHKTIAPEIVFRPEIGIACESDPKIITPWVTDCISSKIFKGIDLYGIENARPPETWKHLFTAAGNIGIKRKLHTGEFGDVKSMAHAIQVLEPDTIQHGIVAAESKDLMHRLAQDGITLNICPTSNLRLRRVESYGTHPIRTLFDAGVSVTINSDDIMLFESNVTDEYFQLFDHEVFSANELNSIRINGLIQ